MGHLSRSMTSTRYRPLTALCLGMLLIVRLAVSRDLAQPITTAMSHSSAEFTDTAIRMLEQTQNTNIRVSAVSIAPPLKLLPFLISTDAIVLVRLEGVQLILNGVTNPYAMNMEICFDQLTGQPIRACSEWPEAVPGVRYPPFDVEEEQLLRRNGGQRILSVPANTPKVSLMDAVRQAEGADYAKQVRVYYATMANALPQRAPTSVWVVQAWGILPFMMHGPAGSKVPEEQRNHKRTVVDADTGLALYWDNIPVPKASVAQ